MADSNTFYYLNSLDKDVDNDILTSLCFEFGNDEKHFDYAGISLACSVMPLKHMNWICNGVPEVSCKHSPSISVNTSPKISLDLSPDASAEASIYIPLKDDISNCMSPSFIKNDLRATALREKLICGVCWKEFGIVENDIVESINVTENDKTLCHGVVTFSGGYRNIYIIGDFCSGPYLKERLLAIIDFSSNYIFCNKLFIRVRKSSLKFEALIKSLVWIGFRVIPSAFFSSQNYILLFIPL